MITRETVARIILAKVLEMPLGKYLDFIETITGDCTKFPNRNTLPVKTSGMSQPTVRLADHIFGKVIVRRNNITFRISDKRLKKLYPTNQYSDDNMVCSINWINTRNTFSMHVLNSLLHYQHRYWLSGNESDLRPLTLKQFLTLYPLQYLDATRLSRLLRQLFVLTPHNAVICLKHLFLSPKRMYAYRIRELIRTHPIPLKDRDIQSLLAQQGIQLSLRTICNCRKLLHIPHYRERACHDYGKNIDFSDYHPLSGKSFNNIPDQPGVYELSIPTKLQYERHKTHIIYIGSSGVLRKRLATYAGNGVKNRLLAQFLKKHDVRVRFFVTDTYRTLEDQLLKNFKDHYGELPKCNSIGG